MGCHSTQSLYSYSTRALVFTIFILILHCGMLKAVRGAGADMLTSLSVSRVVTLTNQCSQRYVQVVGHRINANGKVRKRKNQLAQLLMTSVDYGVVTIQSDQTKEYICFNSRGKLTTRPTKFSGDCVFHETEVNGKYGYQSALNPKLRIGFKKKHGKRLLGSRWANKKDSKLRPCYWFTKPSIEIERRNDPYAPIVNFENVVVNIDNSQHSSHHRDYKLQAPNENAKWAPRLRIRHSHSKLHEKT